MIILSNFTLFCNFTLSLLQYSKFFANIVDSLEFWKFWTHNVKAMANDKRGQYHSYLEFSNLDIHFSS